MIALKTSFGWYVETKEGIKIFESHNAHCSWCAKADGWHKYRELYPKNLNQTKPLGW